tara:strand:- start:1128 stop:2945 length:1818 start_codon:yes stop_codon:yes gene_type:complete
MGLFSKTVGLIEYAPIVKKYIDKSIDTLGGVNDVIKDLINKGDIQQASDLQKLSPRDLATIQFNRERRLLESEARRNKIISVKKEKPVEEIDIFADDIVQTPAPETNFTLDQVPNSSKVINPNSGEVKILVGKKSYPIDQVIMNQGPKAKYFTLKQSPYLKKEDFTNLGVKLSDNQNIKNIMDDYLAGIITKSQAGENLSKIKGMPNFGSDNPLPGKRQLYKPTQKFDPFVEGYISTLKNPPEAIDFFNFINKDQTRGKGITYDKINQTLKIVKSLDNDVFNKIKFPDGTTMKDQPVGTRMYNAYVLGGGSTNDASQYASFVKKYIKPYYGFKNPDAEIIPDFKKNWRSGTTENGLKYDIRKGERNYQIPDEYKPYFNQIKENIYDFIPDGEKGRVGGTFQNQLARMIGYAKEQGTDPDEIIKVIQGIDAEGFANLFTRKKILEENIKNLREQAMSSSLKKTNPELFVDQKRKVGDFDIGLIELSHIEDVAQNWRAAFDINNIFLAPGKFNRDQLIIDKSIGKQLRAFSKAKTFSEKKVIIKELKKIEQKLIDKNLISKFGDRYFGVSKDSEIEANLLKKVEEAVDFTRYLKDGGFASIEEVLEY